MDTKTTTTTTATASAVEPTTTIIDSPTKPVEASESAMAPKPKSLEDDLIDEDSVGDPEKKTDDKDKEECITLVSGDDVKFEVSKEVASLSGLIKTVIEGDMTGTVIPLPNINGNILMMVIDYLKEINVNPPKEIERPIKSNKIADIVNEKSAAFVEVPQDILFALLLAANYLDIKPLLDLVCAKIASMMTGQSVEEIRKTFNIENDFTPQEEADVREENKWAEEN